MRILGNDDDAMWRTLMVKGLGRARCATVEPQDTCPVLRHFSLMEQFPF
jgi:hypothetical protein